MRRQVDVHVWAQRVQVVLGREPRNIREALEGLRQLFGEDEMARRELEQMVQHGYRFIRFDRGDKVALYVWAALKELVQAIASQRKPEEKESSSTRVWIDPSKKEEGSKRVRSLGTWRGPDGQAHEYYPWDLRPSPRPGDKIRHPQAGEGKILRMDVENGVAYVHFPRLGVRKLSLEVVRAWWVDPYAQAPDYRVQKALERLERLSVHREEIWSESRIERARENFYENTKVYIISPEATDILAKAGFPANPENPEELLSLVRLLPAKENEVEETLREAGMGSLAQLLKKEPAREIAREVLRAPLPERTKEEILSRLKEVAALRILKGELQKAGHSLVRAVAYRDPVTGETLAVFPVYG